MIPIHLLLPLLTASSFFQRPVESARFAPFLLADPAGSGRTPLRPTRSPHGSPLYKYHTLLSASRLARHRQEPEKERERERESSVGRCARCQGHAGPIGPLLSSRWPPHALLQPARVSPSLLCTRGRRTTFNPFIQEDTGRSSSLREENLLLSFDLFFHLTELL